MRAASDVTSARWKSMKESGVTISPLFGSRAHAATKDSGSDVPRTGAAIASTRFVAAGGLMSYGGRRRGNRVMGWMAPCGINDYESTRAHA
jgi:hypothetical protein